MFTAGSICLIATAAMVNLAFSAQQQQLILLQQKYCL